jgi:glycine betaine/choline ABC-type transport system substrate-binding protein
VNRQLKVMLAMVLSLAVALVVAACGSDDSSDSSSSSGGGKKTYTPIKKNPDNAGKSVTIGSKNFPEQFILGEIYAQALQAAGYKVKKDLNLGAEQVAYKALRGGQVDAYPEYTGTSLTSFFDVKTDDVPRDPQKAYELTKKNYAKVGITALPITKFENTYNIITTTKLDKSDFDGAKKLSDLTAANTKGKKFAGYPECRQRKDCFLGLKSLYGIDPGFVSTQQTYDALDKGQAQLAAAFSTDGQLNSGKYQVLDDDKHLFPPYQISLGFDKDKLKELGPDAEKTVVYVQKGLTTKNIRNLNQRVAVNKQKPAAVAKFYLQSLGYVK